MGMSFEQASSDLADRIEEFMGQIGELMKQMSIDRLREMGEEHAA